MQPTENYYVAFCYWANPTTEEEALEFFRISPERLSASLESIAWTSQWTVKKERELVGRIYDLATEEAISNLSEKTLKKLVKIGVKILNHDPTKGAVRKFREALFNKYSDDYGLKVSNNLVSINSPLIYWYARKIIKEYSDLITGFYFTPHQYEALRLIESLPLSTKQNLILLGLPDQRELSDKHLIRWAKEMPRLQSVNFGYDNSITAKGFDTLANGCPDLIIIDANRGNPFKLLGLYGEKNLLGSLRREESSRKTVLQAFSEGTEWINLHPGPARQAMEIIIETTPYCLNIALIFPLLERRPELFSDKARAGIEKILPFVTEYHAPHDMTAERLFSLLSKMSKLRKLNLEACKLLTEDDLNRVVLEYTNLQSFRTWLTPLSYWVAWKCIEVRPAAAKDAFCDLTVKEQFRVIFLEEKPVEKLLQLPTFLLCEEQLTLLIEVCKEVRILSTSCTDMERLSGWFPNIQVLYLSEKASGIARAFPDLQELRVKKCSDEEIEEVVENCRLLEVLETPITCRVNPWKDLGLPGSIVSLFNELRVNPTHIRYPIFALQRSDSNWIEKHPELAVRLFKLADEKLLMHANVEWIYRYREYLMPKLQVALEHLTTIDVNGNTECLKWVALQSPNLEEVKNCSENPVYWRILGVDSDVLDLLTYLQNHDEARQTAFKQLVRKDLAPWRKTHVELTRKIFALVNPEEIYVLYREIKNKSGLIQLLWSYDLFARQPKDIHLNGIPVNRLMFAMLSDPLDALLLGNMQESAADSVNIQELTKKAAEVFVSYVKGGVLEQQRLGEEDLIQLTLFAHVYELPGLFQMCQQVLLQWYDIEQLDEFGIELPYVEAHKKLTKLTK